MYEKASRMSDGKTPGKTLTPEAKRALKEAEERRKEAAKKAAQETVAKEIGGRKGPEPTRYGDWEKKGILSDF
jgi:hypothetical protein